MALGFVLITLAVIAGTTWAFVELKTRWIGEPKIAISFFTWGIYLAMVFFRVDRRLARAQSRPDGGDRAGLFAPSPGPRTRGWARCC